MVTAGPSAEPLDEVRRLTNFSTGKLGSELANFLVDRGHRVTLLFGSQATYPGEQKAPQVIPFGTSEDLRIKLQALSAQPVDAVFHAAAVSDFGFGKIWKSLPTGELREIKERKISSGETPLLAELIPTPKIIRSLRHWFPQARLVGWKYEVDGDRATALAKARQQLIENNTDVCVANGPAYGEGFGLLTREGPCAHLPNPQALFHILVEIAVK